MLSLAEPLCQGGLNWIRNLSDNFFLACEILQGDKYILFYAKFHFHQFYKFIKFVILAHAASTESKFIYQYQ